MKVTFWVVVEAKRAYYDATRIRELSAATLRQKKPRLRPDEIAVQVTLDVDTKAFTEPTYSVSGVVDAGQAVAGPGIIIETQPEDPVEGLLT